MAEHYGVWMWTGDEGAADGGWTLVGAAPPLWAGRGMEHAPASRGPHDQLKPLASTGTDGIGRGAERGEDAEGRGSESDGGLDGPWMEHWGGVLETAGGGRKLAVRTPPLWAGRGIEHALASRGSNGQLKPPSPSVKRRKRREKIVGMLTNEETG